MKNGNKRIPAIGRSEYRIIFYHQVTGKIMKYKFKAYRAAIDFFNKLDLEKTKPIMYEIKRIL
ncbi:MAG: hypothetical protein IE931_14700 [Sphingobacteriales bacterium]|nr:hypothetical protein [Sphingobacteriales bacterium]